MGRQSSDYTRSATMKAIISMGCTGNASWVEAYSEKILLPDVTGDVLSKEKQRVPLASCKAQVEVQRK